MHKGGSGRTLLVIGDSHLQAFQNTFADYGATHDVTVHLWLEFGCPWQQGLYLVGRWSERCVPRQQQLYDTTLPTLRPDAIVAVNDAYDDPSLPAHRWVWGPTWSSPSLRPRSSPPFLRRPTR